jgi:Trk K+ transport system NAD-binding subunit
LPPHFLWVEGDPSKESELDKARVSHARAVIIVAEHDVHGSKADAMTILTAFTLRSYMQKQKSARLRKSPLYVVAEILDPENLEHARAAGIDEVVQTKQVGYDLISHAITNPGTGGVLSSIALHSEGSVYVGCPPTEMTLPATYHAVSTHVRDSCGAQVIGFRKTAKEPPQINPPDDTTIETGALLIYLADAPLLEPPPS